MKNDLIERATQVGDAKPRRCRMLPLMLHDNDETLYCPLFTRPFWGPCSFGVCGGRSASCACARANFSMLQLEDIGPMSTRHSNEGTCRLRFQSSAHVWWKGLKGRRRW